MTGFYFRLWVKAEFAIIRCKPQYAKNGVRVMNKKKLAIGVENYKEIIDRSYYYVDKTLLIKELLEKGSKVNLFTRPRRFGKTLTLSMLKTFFEKELNEAGEEIDNRHYFHDMKIMSGGADIVSYMGRYPVISFSLKSARQPDFEMAYQVLTEQIAGEFRRHSYVLKIDLFTEDEIKKYQRFMAQKASASEYATALKFLTDCLKKFHNQRVIILLDEYDVPLENAYFKGFYDEMTDYIRSLFESALKTNDSLEFAVITGCLRISRESIFTGLNNLKIISVLDQSYAEYFGFTPWEVKEMLLSYGLQDREQEVRKWYDGYLFGETSVYNPWSVLNYIDDALENRNIFPRPYWSNTSSNSIIKELVVNADMTARREIEDLIAGKYIEKPIHEEVTYGDIHRSQDYLWNFLFFTGYLRKRGERQEQRMIYLQMEIPNQEVLYIYENTIQEWFNEKIKAEDFAPLYQAITQGNSDVTENILKTQLMSSISYFDNAESFYHGFMIGMFMGLQNYEVLSNRESGMGRPDILLKPYDNLLPAVIIELKNTDKFTMMEEQCSRALKQIEEKHYEEELLAEGYRVIRRCGICFCKKNCMVKME